MASECDGFITVQEMKSLRQPIGIRN